MNIYNIPSDRNALQIRQLIQLKSDCLRLQWSRVIEDIPRDVSDSLDVIEEFTTKTITNLCEDAEYSCELSSQEEDKILKLIRGNKTVKSIIGSGVIMSGDESEKVKDVLEHETDVPQALLESLSYKGCTILF